MHGFCNEGRFEEQVESCHGDALAGNASRLRREEERERERERESRQRVRESESERGGREGRRERAEYL